MNPGKNNIGQKKRGRPRSGAVSKNYIEEDAKRIDSTFKRKTTIINEVITELKYYIHFYPLCLCHPAEFP
jgi:hypothetical protein